MLPLDIHRACEAAVRSLNLMARDRGIELAYDQVPMRICQWLIINQESIERVVINLLNNGIKYTPEGRQKSQ
jgi:signal transduction histidine kinase